VSPAALVASWAAEDNADAARRREERARGLRSRRTVQVLERDLRHVVLGAGTDSEIAQHRGVAPSAVRFLRSRLVRDLHVADLLAMLDELAELLGWSGSRAALLREVVSRAVQRAREAQQRAA
jgi:hypothetical protein